MKAIRRVMLFVLLGAIPTSSQAAGGSHLSPGTQAAQAGHEDRADRRSVEWSGGAGQPSLELTVEKDLHGGWNLFLAAGRFRFAPENAGKDHVPGEGHAQLYVNGHKQARLYGPWYHLSALPPGRNRLSVTLNSNDHRPYAVEGKVLRGFATIEVAAPRIVELVVESGKLTAGPNPIRVKQGDRVELRVRTDEPAEMHIHGYDIKQPIRPRPDLVAFAADLAGRFVIESHRQRQGKKASHSILTYLEVHPD